MTANEFAKLLNTLDGCIGAGDIYKRYTPRDKLIFLLGMMAGSEFAHQTLVCSVGLAAMDLADQMPDELKDIFGAFCN